MARATVGVDLEEIEAVYRRELAKLQRLATAIVGSRDGGCDAVQDAFARAVQRRAEFRREGHLEGWIWRIVVSTSRETAARNARHESPVADSPLGAVSTSPEPTSAVTALVAQLPERQRLVLFLRYYADLDYGAIAEALEVSVGTVGATLNQARDRLRGLLLEVPG